MQHIEGISRHQLRFSSLEDAISADNQVRFIDAFVSFIDLSKLGFAIKTLKHQGRPSYRISIFLKLYLYGYLNGIRSSRKLEAECFRNIELKWLLEDIHPNYHSISDFRKENPLALKNTFKLFVSFLKDADLIGLEKVNGEHSLIMLVYNIKRSIDILGVPNLIAKLQKWNSPLQGKSLVFAKNGVFKAEIRLRFLSN